MAATIQTASRPLHPRVLDTSGNNNHGTAYTGQALEFDGVSDYITMPNTGGGYTELTLSAWVKKTIGNAGSIFGHEGGGSYFRWTNTTNLHLYIDGTTADISFNDGASFIDDGQWHYYVVTYNGGTGAKLYIDGQLGASESVVTSQITSAKGFGNVGAYNGINTPAHYLDGSMSNAQIWNKEFSADDVSYAYANPEKLALDNYGTSLTYSNLKLWYPMQDGDRGNQSYLLDGANTGKYVIGTSDGGTFTGSNPSIYPLDDNGNQIAKVVGQAYEYTWTITENTSGTGVKVFPESSTYVNAVGTYTETWVATSTVFLRIYVHGFVGKVSNVSVSAVNLKKHGTSVFYGDEEWAIGNLAVEAANGSNILGTATADGDDINCVSRFSSGANTKVSSVGDGVYGRSWQLVYTVSGYVAGNVRLSVGNDIGATRTADGTYTEIITQIAGAAASYIYGGGIGSDIVTNGDFGSATGWGAGTGWAIDTSAGTLTGSSTTDVTVQTLLTVGRTYKCIWVIDSVAGGTVKLALGTTSGATQTEAGTFTEYITCAGNTNLLIDGVSSFSGVISNISIQEMGFTGTIEDVSIKEVGFAKGWTDADAQPTIPQLGFQSYNQLAWFDGTADTLIVADTSNDNDNIFDGGGSISAWIYVNGIGGSTYGRIVDKSTSTGGADGYGFFVREESGSTCKIGFNKGFSSTHGTWTTTNEDITYGKWYHAVLTYDDDAVGNNPTLYLNGVSSAFTEVAAPVGTSESDASQALTIGNRSGNTDRGFEGSITEVSLWTEELTLAKVQELYNDGEALDALTHSSKTNLKGYWRNKGNTTWTDLKGSNNGTPASIAEHLTLPEGQNSRDTQGFLMNRVRSSGLNNGVVNTGGHRHAYIDSGASTIAAGTDFTIGFWAKTFSFVASNVMGASGTDFINLSNDGADAKLYIEMNNSAFGETFPDVSTTHGIGQWYYWTITRGELGANKLRFYLNGAINAHSSEVTNDVAAHPFDLRYLGTVAAASNSFMGQLDDIVIYNSTALTPAQVLRNYKAGKGRHRN